jgi:hypothetical protein
MRLMHAVLPAVALGLLVIAVPSADAASKPKLQITTIRYDPPGKDVRTKKQLDAEYVVIKNNTKTAKDLDGYTLRDTSRHVYSFGDVRLKAGHSIKVHTGRGSDSSTNVYWDSGNFIWNNTGDKATLKSSSGKTLDSCSYTEKSGRSAVSC